MDSKEYKKEDVVSMKNGFESTEIFSLMSADRRSNPIKPVACGLAEMNYLLLLYSQTHFSIYTSHFSSFGEAYILEKLALTSSSIKIGTNTQLILSGPLAGAIIPSKDSTHQHRVYRPLAPHVFEHLVYLFCELPMQLKISALTQYLDVLFLLMREKNIPVDEDIFRNNCTSFGEWLKTVRKR